MHTFLIEFVEVVREPTDIVVKVPKPNPEYQQQQNVRAQPKQQQFQQQPSQGQYRQQSRPESRQQYEQYEQ